MKKTILSLLLTLSLLLGMLPSVSALWEPEFPLEGASIYLFDLSTGEEIVARNIHERRSPASLTKMMTVLLVLEQGIDWNQTVTVPQRLSEELELIERENGMSIYMQPGETFTVEQLLYLTMLPSCNDAASVLADYAGGGLDAFIDRMNARARELGCTETEFNCAHGLFEEIGEGNWSSAADMALIARECIRHPQFVQLMTATEYDLPFTKTRTQAHWSGNAAKGIYRVMYSTNPLQKPESSLYRSYDRGVKTGYTTWAEKCFVTVFEGNDTRYLLVEMGVPNTENEQGEPLVFQQAAALGDWVTEDFSLRQLAADRGCVASTEVLYSPDGVSVPLLVSGNLTALVNKNDEITQDFEIPDRLIAPITAGTVVGNLTISRNGEPLGRLELVAGQDMRYSVLEQLKGTLSELLIKLLRKG